LPQNFKPFFNPNQYPKKIKGGLKTFFSINPIFSTQLYIFLVPTTLIYLEGCLPKPFKPPKQQGYPNIFCGTHHQAQQPNSSFLFLVLYLSEILSSCPPLSEGCLPKHLLPRCACSPPFNKGPQSYQSLSPRVPCKPCPFNKECSESFQQGLKAN
jgi:hypothetical protein